MGHQVGAAALVFLARLLCSQAASITNCGGASDVFQVSELSVSPDPVQHRAPFTITATGTLGKDITGGTVSADLVAKILVLGQALIDKDVHNITQFELDPGVPSGNVKLVIGPVTLPPLPGSFDISGKINIVDVDGAAVSCIQLDFHAPLSGALLTSPLDTSSCAKPGDHLHDVVRSQDGDWNKISATLDESVTQMTINAQFQVAIGLLPLKIKLDVPVLYEPGIPQGPMTIRSKPAPSAMTTQPEKNSGPMPHITGDIIVLDAKGEEVTCKHIDNEAPGAAVHEDLVVV